MILDRRVIGLLTALLGYCLGHFSQTSDVAAAGCRPTPSS